MKLRVAHIIVQPVLVWDDGEELTPGPELGVIHLPLSKLGGFGESLPAEVEALQAKLEGEATTSNGATLEKNGVRVYGPMPDGSFIASSGGAWVPGSWPTAEEALAGATTTEPEGSPALP